MRLVFCLDTRKTEEHRGNRISLRIISRFRRTRVRAVYTRLDYFTRNSMPDGGRGQYFVDGSAACIAAIGGSTRRAFSGTDFNECIFTTFCREETLLILLDDLHQFCPVCVCV